MILIDPSFAFYLLLALITHYLSLPVKLINPRTLFNTSDIHTRTISILPVLPG